MIQRIPPVVTGLPGTQMITAAPSCYGRGGKDGPGCLDLPGIKQTVPAPATNPGYFLVPDCTASGTVGCVRILKSTPTPYPEGTSAERTSITFEKQSSTVVDGGYAFAFGDYDNDGRLDMIANRRLYQNQGGGACWPLPEQTRKCTC